MSSSSHGHCFSRHSRKLCKEVIGGASLVVQGSAHICGIRDITRRSETPCLILVFCHGHYMLFLWYKFVGLVKAKLASSTVL
jgi:hypothetical protein